ncbi:MAG: SpoIIE family protein phosphatase [Candidatus Puniceispirillales bacterium]
MSITQKLFAFLVIVIVLPMVLSVAVITSRSKEISNQVNTAINALETQFTVDLAGSTGQLIEASSDELDMLTQHNWERLTVFLADAVADFLHDRDRDLLFLADSLDSTSDKQALLDRFRQRRSGFVTVPTAHGHDPETDTWQRRASAVSPAYSRKTANLENSNSFQFTIPDHPQKIARPIYREITLLDLDGREIAKSSDINPERGVVTDRQATFAASERYFDDLSRLNDGEIYVSEVIGAYRPTHMIGPYTKARADKAGIDFDPAGSAYAGLENPAGQRFEGIIRFATPVVENGVKTGYLTMALDHRHIMEFTDYVIPENNYLGQTADEDDLSRHAFRADIKDASKGNYAFMWDYQGRSIAHPREYFITGFDPETGQRVPGWISAGMAIAFKASGQDDLNTWLAEESPYSDQSRNNKPNVAQIRSGHIPLDCRYLDFAPQCAGWHEINSTGGFGSFQIFWSGIWKLTTAATIPYYTGRYGESRRGFGFITIGANLGEFTRSGKQSQENLKVLIGDVNQTISKNIRNIGSNTRDAMTGFQDQMLYISIFMIFGVMVFTILAGNNIRSRVAELIKGTSSLSAGDLKTRITVGGRDELAKIGTAFNAMAETLQQSREEIEQVNSNLEKRVAERTEQLRDSNQQISDSIDYASRIQRSLLPDQDRLKRALTEMAIVWQPKDVVGGDFYWHKTIGDREYLVVMDCTGHGVPGAFMTMVATSVLEQITAASTASLGRWEMTPEVADLMQQLHDGVSLQLNQINGGGLSNDGLDAVFLSIPKQGGDVQFCGASMDIYTVNDQGEATRWRGSKTSLGYTYTGAPLKLEQVSVPLDGNTTFVITTDGITTQVGESTPRGLGYRRFQEALESVGGNSPKMLNRAIMRAFREWQGNEERRDDITLVSFKPETL